MFYGDMSRCMETRLLCLVVGCMMVAGSGPILGFNVYSVAVKDVYNFTQTDLELCASFVGFGHKMVFPASILHEKIGTQATAAVASATSLLSWILLYSSSLTPQYYVGMVYPIAIYFFFAGFGAALAFMAAVPVNFENYRGSQRGWVVSCLEGFYSVAPSIVSLIYSRCFVGDHEFYPSLMNQNLSGFFLLCALSWPVIYALGIFFLKRHPIDGSKGDRSSLLQENPSETTNTIKDDYAELPSSNGLPEQSGQVDTTSKPVYPKNISPFMLDSIMTSDRGSVWGWRLLKDVDFMLLIFSCLIFSGVLTLYINNMTSILLSYREYSSVELFTVVGPIISAVTLFFCGPISDHLADYVPRQVFLLFAHFLLFLAMLLLLTLHQTLTRLVVTMVMIKMAGGIIFCITSTIISESYGVYYFGRNWGGALLGSAFSSLAFQWVLGYYYEQALEKEGLRYCFGSRCYQQTLIIVCIIMAVALIMDVVLWARSAINYNRNSQVALIKNDYPTYTEEQTNTK